MENKAEQLVMVLEPSRRSWLYYRYTEGHKHPYARGRGETSREKQLMRLFSNIISVPCLLFLGPCHKRRVGGCCTQLGSLSALKHAVLGLYLLVFLILVGIFILAGKSSLFVSKTLGMIEEDSEPPCPCCGNHGGGCWQVFLIRQRLW